MPVRTVTGITHVAHWVPPLEPTILRSKAKTEKSPRDVTHETKCTDGVVDLSAAPANSTAPYIVPVLGLHGLTRLLFRISLETAIAFFNFCPEMSCTCFWIRHRLVGGRRRV